MASLVVKRFVIYLMADSGFSVGNLLNRLLTLQNLNTGRKAFLEQLGDEIDRMECNAIPI